MFNDVKVTASSEHDKEWVKSLPTYDNTKLTNLNTCLRWGLIRYDQHKTNQKAGRAMALEAGHAAHEGFAAHRLYQLLHADSTKADLDTYEQVVAHGQRLFPNDRYEEMCNVVNPADDYRSNMMKFSLEAVYTSGFYDEPGETRKTMSNIETMMIYYIDRFDWRNELPVVLDDFIGIEVPVDVVVTFDDNLHIRFIGKVDGVHWRDQTQTEMRIHENKTASRLGEAWSMSFDTNHQPTGYLIALSSMLHSSITRATIIGSCLPLPSNASISGLERLNIGRTPDQFVQWFRWLFHTHTIAEQFRDDPINAPMYTHSCNRYFRPCSFTTFCSMGEDERREYFEQMRRDKWTPLEEERDDAQST